MKTEINSFSNELLDQYKVLFVYGNFLELADMLFDSYVAYKQQSKCSCKCKTLTAADFLKQQQYVQESLFNSSLFIYRIANVLDSNVSSFLEKLKTAKDAIFVVTPGDFKKSKNASSVMCNESNYLSMPSFKNGFTYSAISKYFFKGASPNDIKSIASLLEKDASSSMLLKLTLLYESDPAAISSYTVETNNWIFDMQPIALLRFLSACEAKGSLEKVLEPLLKTQKKLPPLSEYFLKTEIQIKSGEDISNEMILGHLQKLTHTIN